MSENILELTAFGASYFERKGDIEKKIKISDESYSLEFMGKYQKIPIIEVRIDLPVYRLNNGRTKSFQKEYLATHPKVDKDLFLRDHDSIEAQKAQHQILMDLADEENLLRSFRQGDLQQTEPLISTIDGVVVNGNRRLSVWRELFHSDKKKYKYFETIKLAVLPDCDERAIRDLEKRLQVQNPMKADYHWHTLALMASEDIEQGVSQKKVAESFGKSVQQINTMIECRQYAETYLLAIDKPEQWSIVDKNMHAFDQMVKGRKKLEGSGKKELFEILAFTFIDSSKNEGRLYELIPSISENLIPILEVLTERLEISASDNISSDFSLLLGDDSEVLEPSGLIAKEIRDFEDKDFIRKVAISVIETQNQLKDEQNKENFILNHVTRAATLLTEVLTTRDRINSINLKGIKLQLKNIKEKVVAIEKWLGEIDGNKN